MNILQKHQYILAFLLIGFFSNNGLSQCDGPFNNGDLNVLTAGPDSITTSISECDFYIHIGNSAGPININSDSGLEFLVDPNNTAQVLNVAAGTPITTGTYMSGPKLIYNSSTYSGPFGGGRSGFIAVRKNGRFGWIELGDCGTTNCNLDAFEYPILDRCLNTVTGGAVRAGVKSTLTAPAAVPTLSEWSLIALSLVLMIVGIVALKQAIPQIKSES